MEFTFWDEQWQEHTEPEGKQRGKTFIPIDTSKDDNSSKKGQD